LQWVWLGVHVVTTTVTVMITTVVTITNTVTVITMTADTVGREGLQMKRIKMKESVSMIRKWLGYGLRSKLAPHMDASFVQGARLRGRGIRPRPSGA